MFASSISCLTDQARSGDKNPAEAGDICMTPAHENVSNVCCSSLTLVDPAITRDDGVPSQPTGLSGSVEAFCEDFTHSTHTEKIDTGSCAYKDDCGVGTMGCVRVINTDNNDNTDESNDRAVIAGRDEDNDVGSLATALDIHNDDLEDIDEARSDAETTDIYCDYLK